MGYESRVLNTPTTGHVTSENCPHVSPWIEHSIPSYHAFGFDENNRSSLRLVRRLRHGDGLGDTFAIKRRRRERPKGGKVRRRVILIVA